MLTMLIIGGSGYLGSNFAVFAQEVNECKVYSTYSREKGALPPCVPLDITDETSVDHLLTQLKPEVIIHAAALTNSNYCAAYQEEAWNVNVVGTQNIVKSGSRIGARIIYISSDQVYEGSRSFYTEDDDSYPVSYYGKTKLEAEKTVASGSDNYCIARTSLIYGMSKTKKVTFFDKLVTNLFENKPTQLFVDEYRTPIFLDNYCAILMELAHNWEIQGLFNVSGNERVSRYELGKYVTNTLSKRQSLLVPFSISEFGFLDIRPYDCSMSNNAISRVLSTKIVDIKTASELIKIQAMG